MTLSLWPLKASVVLSPLQESHWASFMLKLEKQPTSDPPSRNALIEAIVRIYVRQASIRPIIDSSHGSILLVLILIMFEWVNRLSAGVKCGSPPGVGVATHGHYLRRHHVTLSGAGT